MREARMSITRCIVFAVTLTGLALPARAADYSDPTWPCVQRKVESLSVGLMWPFPIDPAVAAEDAALQADVAELADTLALRRVALEDVTGAVEAFAARYDGDPARLGLVFDRAFQSLSKRRSRIIQGIGDFSLGQIALAEKIDGARDEMTTALAADAPDYDRIDVLEEQLDWDQVIYTDRQRSIVYLCETPTILERRLFEIARMLQAVARENG
jgi:hypothetical protein